MRSVIPRKKPNLAPDCRVLSQLFKRDWQSKRTATLLYEKNKTQVNRLTIDCDRINIPQMFRDEGLIFALTSTKRPAITWLL